MHTVGAIGDLDCRDAETRDGMSVPEADTSCEQDGFVGSELLDHLRNGCLCKVRQGHDVSIYL